MFSVTVNTDIVTSADVVFCNKESFDVAFDKSFILVWDCDAFVRLLWPVVSRWSKHLSFLDDCTEYSLCTNITLKPMGKCKTHMTIHLGKGRHFFNLF